MGLIVRLGSGAAGVVALALALTATAFAGNFAEVTFRPSAEIPPVAGAEQEIRFSLLQHGVTPVTSGEAEVTATLPTSGERVDARATSIGGGDWTATITFAVGGDWLIGVTHSELATSPPVNWSVGADEAAAASLAPTGPAYVAVGLLAAALLGAGVVTYAVRVTRRSELAGAAASADGSGAQSAA